MLKSLNHQYKFFVQICFAQAGLKNYGLLPQRKQKGNKQNIKKKT